MLTSLLSEHAAEADCVHAAHTDSEALAGSLPHGHKCVMHAWLVFFLHDYTKHNAFPHSVAKKAGQLTPEFLLGSASK